MAKFPEILRKIADWDLLFQLIAVVAIILIGIVAYCFG